MLHISEILIIGRDENDIINIKSLIENQSFSVLSLIIPAHESEIRKLSSKVKNELVIVYCGQNSELPHDIKNIKSLIPHSLFIILENNVTRNEIPHDFSGSDFLLINENQLNTFLNLFDQFGENKKNNNTAIPNYYKTLFNNSPDAIILFQNEKIIAVNKKSLELFKCTEEAVINQPLSTILPDVQPGGKESKSEIAAELKGASFTEPVDFYWTFKKCNGNFFNAAVSISVSEYLGSMVYQAVLRAINEDKDDIESLSRSEDKYRFLFEKNVVGAFRATIEGVLLDCNKAYSDLLGYNNPDELRGISELTFYLSHDDRKRITYRLIEKGEIQNYEICLLTKDGRKIWVLENAALFKESSQSSPIIYGTLINITDRKKAQEAVKIAEKKYKYIFENSVHGIIQATPEGKIITANPALASILGYNSPEELKSSIKNLAEDVYADREKRYELLAIIKKRGWIKGFELEVYKKDKTKIWLSVNGTGKFDSSGNIEFTETIIEDITERKIAERSLKESEAQYRQLFDAIPLPVIIFELISLKILRVNNAAIRLYQYTREEFLNLTVKDIRPEGQIKKFQALVDSVYDEKATIRGWQHQKKDRSLIDVEISVHTVSYKGIKARLAVIYDITEQTQLLKEMISAKNKAEEANRLKSGFLHAISHEIRTPLNGIIGFTGVLKDTFYDDANEEVKMFFNSIDESTSRLLRSMTQIIDIARIEVDEFPVYVREISLKNIIYPLINKFEKECYHKNIKLTYSSSTENDLVLGDEYCLTGALEHIIDNAIKYSNEGSIIIYTTHNDGTVWLKVKDEGIGIDDEYQKHLFETFSQEKTGINRPYEGTGLGLALTKRYLKLMESTITIQSKKGSGTEVSIELRKSGPK